MNKMAANRIPTTIMDEMAAMSAAEAICTLILARATYGRGERWTRLTYADFQQQSMYQGSATIARALKAVLRRGLFRRLANSSVWVIEAPVLTIAQERPAQGERSPEPAADGPAVLAAAQSPAAADPAAAARGASLIEESASLSEEDASLSEACPSLSEESASLSEEDASLSEACPSLSEEHPSLSEEDAPLSEESSLGGGADGPKIEPVDAGNGPEIEPFPFNKEKDLNGQVRERERKKEETVSACGSPLQRPFRRSSLPEPRRAPTSKDESRAAQNENPALPRPRTPSEESLAQHPATKAWLAAGLSWPGWRLLRLIIARMGEQPQQAALSQAYDRWLMAGYRPGNIDGILDWYEQLCCDPAWQPYKKSNGYAVESHKLGPGAPDFSIPQSPGMAMLFKIREEISNGQQSENSGLFDHAASGLSAGRTGVANH